MDAVRCYTDGNQKSWDIHLAQIAGALRSSVNGSTGFTPNRMMLGREVNQPADILFPMKKPVHEVSPFQYIAELEKAMKTAHEVARKHLKASQERMKRNYDLKVYTKAFEAGDLVYILDTAVVKGQCRKLSSPWKGPGIVVTKFSPYLYRVKLKNAVFTANHDRLKPCRDKKLPEWLSRFKDNFLSDLQRSQSHSSTDSHRPVYCICRGPDRGDFMIQCYTCTEWFHGTCVGITPQEAMYMKRYKCPPCSQPALKK